MIRPYLPNQHISGLATCELLVIDVQSQILDVDRFYLQFQRLLFLPSCCHSLMSKKAFGRDYSVKVDPTC